MQTRRIPSRLKNVSEKYSIAIICEGNEEYKYMQKLKSLELWNKKYNITFFNANSSTKIFAKYQNLHSNESFNIILIFCDTDDQEFPSENNQYQRLKKKIKSHHNIKHVPIIIFANPCTMQIILSHFDSVKLKSRKKTGNQTVIK